MGQPTTQTAPQGSIFAPAIRRLPAGSSGLPRELIEASQRQRLLFGVTDAVAEKGYGPTTIHDITTRAGVSKKTFYEHFADKPACFLAAYDVGCDALLAAVSAAARDDHEAGVPALERLQNSVRAYLDFLVTEATYAHMFFLEILSAGSEAVVRRRRCHDRFAAAVHAWHDVARAEDRALPEVPARAYDAVVGATHEMVLHYVASGRTAALHELEDDIVYVHLALLGVPA